MTLNENAKTGTLKNSATVAGTPPTGDPLEPEPKETEHPIVDPGFEIKKTADPASGTTVKGGDIVTYTLTAKNTGNVTLNPAELTDDLSGVLTNATYNDDAAASVGTVAVSGTTLTWTGELAKDEEATVTYSVTVNEDAEGTSLTNILKGSGTPLIPTGDPEDPNEPGEPIIPDEETTTHPLNDPKFDLVKTSDPASGEQLEPGDEVTYTVTGTNSGNLDLTNVKITDDLTSVLASATITAGPTASVGTAEVVGDTLSWTGDLDVGESVTITYKVKVYEENPGKFVNNTVNGEATPLIPNPDDPDDPTRGELITPPETGTFHPIYDPGFEIAKSSTPESGTKVMPNGTVGYTVTGTNTGNTVLEPFTLTDDLSDVLKNATYNGDAKAIITDSEGDETVSTVTPQFDAEAETLTWASELKVDESVQITYTVKIKSYTTLPTDDSIVNTVVGEATPQIPADPSDPNSPTTPGEPLEPIEDSTTHELVLPCLCLDKDSDPESGAAVAPGEEVTYTVTATNSRDDADLVDVTVTDDLSAVLEYATLVDGSIKAEGATGTTAYDPATKMITWEGIILQGEVLELSYTVKVNADGAPGLLKNTAKGEGYVSYDGERLPDPVKPPAVKTSHPVVKSGFEVTKVSDPVSGTAVAPGDEVTYTVTGTNTGETVLDPATLEDDLSGVLNNAALSEEPSADKGDLERDGDLLKWEGTLQPGESVEITYTVTVNEDVSKVQLHNVVTGEGTPLVPTDPTDPESPTKPGEPITPEEAETSHPVVSPGFTVAKSSTPDTETAVDPAQEITYTVTGTNTGDTELANVTITDDLSGVLANATLVGEPTADKPGIPAVTGQDLTWIGDLGEGETVTITYTVKVNGDAAGQRIHNLVEGTATPLIPEDPADPDSPTHESDEQLSVGPVETEHPVNTPGFEMAKSVSPEAGTAVDPGDVLTYTVTGTNTGQTALSPVVIEDDLTEVLKYATYNDDAVSSIDGTLTVVGNELRWEGDLAVDESVEITYSVTVLGSAVGKNLENVVVGTATPPGGPDFNLTPPRVPTNNPVNVPGLSNSKAADPAPGTNVDPGQVIEYTVTTKNTGQMRLDPVVVTDDLAQVLPYASYNGDAVLTSDMGF